MKFKGQVVRIMVNEPYEFTVRDLYGTIQYSSEDEYSIVVKMTSTIKGEKLTSDLIELKPRYKNESFKNLSQFNHLEINGALVNEITQEYDFIIIGTVVIIPHL